jgi:glutathione S-transferase
MAQEKARKDSARYLSVVSEHLDRHDWMLGNEFSLVDCCYGPLLDALALAGDEMAAYPAIGRYLSRIRARKAWKACQFRS